MKPSKNLASGTLFDDIKVKLQKANANNIIKGMGYTSTKTGIKTLEKFLACSGICDWLISGHYDFRYGSKEFLEKLTTLLEVNSRSYKTEINHCTKIKNELKKIRNCYIFVNTNFRRISQPIFALAFMEGHRRLVPAKQELMFKTDKQIFNNISKLVKKYYLKTHGELLIWGKIDNYLYHHFDGNKYAFDRNGHLLEDCAGIHESIATISIK